MAVGATAIAALYGVTDEFHQYFVPPRQVEALDVVADTIGAAIAAFGLHAVARLRRRTQADGDARPQRRRGI
jgi:VanZ family protein